MLIADLRPPNNLSHGFEFQKADVTIWTDLVALMKVAKEKFGTIDMVCANVGSDDNGIEEFLTSETFSYT